MRILGQEINYMSDDDLIFGRNFHKIIAFCIFPLMLCYGIFYVSTLFLDHPSYDPIRTVLFFVFLFLFLPYLYCMIKSHAAYQEIKDRQITHAAKIRYSKARKIALWIYTILVGIIVVAVLIATSSNSNSYSSSNKKETGYWGSDGYYNPSDDEMDEVWDDVYDWMEDNW